MKKLRIFIGFFVGLLCFSTLSAQRFCNEPSDGPCWTATIVNELDCNLELHSDYLVGAECPMIQGGIWKTTEVAPNTTGIYAPYPRLIGCDPTLLYCGDHSSCLECRCPLFMRIKDWFKEAYVPWAYTNGGVVDPFTPVSSDSHASFTDCTRQDVYVDIVVTGANSVKMTFHY